jgi:hypothetical protein
VPIELFKGVPLSLKETIEKLKVGSMEEDPHSQRLANGLSQNVPPIWE